VNYVIITANRLEPVILTGIGVNNKLKQMTIGITFTVRDKY
jgi:hypothetical protein